jgi:hypothetical protein
MADPTAWYSALSPEIMGSDAYDDILNAIHDPRVVHGMIVSANFYAPSEAQCSDA